MKVLSIAAVVTAALLVALAPAIGAIYRDAYPNDGTKRAALAACGQTDPDFNRLRAEDRAQCYARFLPALPAASPPIPRREQTVELGSGLG